MKQICHTDEMGCIMEVGQEPLLFYMGTRIVGEKSDEDIYLPGQTGGYYDLYL